MPALTGTAYTNGATGATELSTTTTIGASDVIIAVGVAIRTATVNIDSVELNGKPMTMKKSVSNGTDVKVELWERAVESDDVGDFPVVVSLDGASDIRVCALPLTGVIAHGSDASDTDTGTAVSTAFTHTDGRVQIDFVGVGNAAPSTLTVPATQDEKSNNNSGQVSLACSAKHYGTGYSNDMTWTIGASQAWAQIVADYTLLPIYGTATISFAIGAVATGAPTTTFTDGIDVNCVFDQTIGVNFP